MSITAVLLKLTRAHKIYQVKNQWIFPLLSHSTQSKSPKASSNRKKFDFSRKIPILPSENIVWKKTSLIDRVHEQFERSALNKTVVHWTHPFLCRNRLWRLSISIGLCVHVWHTIKTHWKIVSVSMLKNSNQMKTEIFVCINLFRSFDFYSVRSGMAFQTTRNQTVVT